MLREEGQRRHSQRNQPEVIAGANPEGQEGETEGKYWPEAQRVNRSLGKEISGTDQSLQTRRRSTKPKDRRWVW